MRSQSNFCAVGIIYASVSKIMLFRSNLFVFKVFYTIPWCSCVGAKGLCSFMVAKMRRGEWFYGTDEFESYGEEA